MAPQQDVISPAVASAIAAKAAKQTITNQQAQALKIDADTSTAKAVRLEHLQRIKLLKAQEKALGVPATIGNAVQNLDKSFKQKMDDIEWDGLWDQAIRDIGSVTDSAKSLIPTLRRDRDKKDPGITEWERVNKRPWPYGKKLNK